jgi:hypothetical protein
LARIDDTLMGKFFSCRCIDNRRMGANNGPSLLSLLSVGDTSGASRSNLDASRRPTRWAGSDIARMTWSIPSWKQAECNRMREASRSFSSSASGTSPSQASLPVRTAQRSYRPSSWRPASRPGRQRDYPAGRPAAPYPGSARTRDRRSAPVVPRPPPRHPCVCSSPLRGDIPSLCCQSRPLEPVPLPAGPLPRVGTRSGQAPLLREEEDCPGHCT